LVGQVQFDRPAGEAEERGEPAVPERPEAGAESLRVPRELQQDVRPRAVGQAPDDPGDVLRPGIQHPVGPEAPGEPEAVRVHIRGHHERGAGLARHQDGAQPDRTTPHDDDRAGAEIRGEGRVHRVAERVHRRRDLERSLGIHLPRVLRGEHHVVGKRSVPVDPDDLERLTDMRLPAPAQVTPAAADVGLAGDEIPERHTVHLRAGGDHGAAELVPDHARRAHTGGGPRIPPVDVEIGAADAPRADLDEDLAEAGRGDRDRPDLEARARCGLHERPHRAAHLREALDEPDDGVDPAVEIRQVELLVGRVQVVVRQAEAHEHRRRVEHVQELRRDRDGAALPHIYGLAPERRLERPRGADRKSTRLNSSHVAISYAVFCLKKKTTSALTSKTNWQVYYGESMMSYLTQMSGLAYNNFVSAAVDIVITLVLILRIS